MDPDKQAVPKVTLRYLIEGVTITGALLLVAFCFADPSTKGMIIGVLGGTAYDQAGAAAHADQASPGVPADVPPLHLLGHGCRQEYGFEICEGEVLKTSTERLENVMVKVVFKDGAGGFIKAEDALVDYQPLMPGQTSPWKVGTIDNPLIRHYTTRFKQMLGGELKAVR